MGVKKRFVMLVLGALSVVAFGCSSLPQAPRSSEGEKLEMFLLSNRGNPEELTDREYGRRNEVGEWMERDLVNMLRRSGYEVRLISSMDDFEPALERYLLEVSIESYHAGSSAARAFVGYGAGAASLDNSYRLYGTEDQPLLDWEDGVGTSQDWRRLPRTLNQNAVRRVTEYLISSSRR